MPMPTLPWIATALLVVLAMLTAPLAAAGAETEVDLELVLAVDVSLSMDTGEQKVQRDGYIAAFRHPDVIAAITSGLLRTHRRHLRGMGRHRLAIRAGAVDRHRRAAKCRTVCRISRFGALSSRYYRTSISAVLAFAAVNLDANDFVAPRRVIDVSGDGANNQGLPVTAVRDAVVASGIVINGLPILTNPLNYDGFFDLQEIDIYYEDCVIGGPRGLHRAGDRPGPVRHRHPPQAGAGDRPMPGARPAGGRGDGRAAHRLPGGREDVGRMAQPPG